MSYILFFKNNSKIVTRAQYIDACMLEYLVMLKDIYE